MARIEGVPIKRAGLLVRVAYWFSKRMVGKVAEPLAVTANHPWIFRGYSSYEFALSKASSVDARTKALAGVKAAVLIGCPF